MDEEPSDSTAGVDLQDANDKQFLTESVNSNHDLERLAPNGDDDPTSAACTTKDHLPVHQIRTYKIRYLLLFMFVALSMTNAFQWIEYAIIESTVSRFYNVDTFYVNCTSVVYMVCYIVGIIPATWLLDHVGLRPCLIVASLGNALGSWIKCLSVRPDLFWVSMLGQTIVATSQLFILNIPPLLAATWFPAADVTKATAYGVFGNQVGIALGFFIPPMLVPDPVKVVNTTIYANGTNLTTTTELPSLPDEYNFTHTATGFKYLFYSVSVITSIIFLLILAFFENRPKYPPSEAAAYAQSLNDQQSFGKSIRALLCNCNFVLLFFSYGLNTGVFYAISTVLSQMVNREFGDGFTREAGYMGLTITLAGIVGSLVCGYILGYSKRFKAVTLFVYIFSLLGTIAFAVGLVVHSVWLLFGISGLLGFFMTGYLPIGFEFAAEVSYPQPEGTSAGLLNASAQIFGILFTFGSSPVIDRFGHLQANLSFIAALVVGAILTLLVKEDLRRQNAQMSTLSGTKTRCRSLQNGVICHT